MTIIDIVVVLFLLMGLIAGFKRGLIQSTVVFMGSIILVIFSYLLKDAVSVVFYTRLPFFKFGGFFDGVTVLNILIYELLAFLVIFVVLSLVLRLIVKATGILEKILKYTIVLGIPSKILGAVFGFIESFIILFIILFVLAHINYTKDIFKDSKYTNTILTKSPVLSKIADQTYNSVNEIMGLKDIYKNNDSKKINSAALEILLKYDIITPKNVEKLIKMDKIEIDNSDSILNKYREK